MNPQNLFLSILLSYDLVNLTTIGGHKILPEIPKKCQPSNCTNINTFCCYLSKLI